MKRIEFINDRKEANWSFQLNDGRLIKVISLDDPCNLQIRYDTKIDLDNSIAYERGDVIPADAKITTFNDLCKAGIGKMLYIYDEYDVFVGHKKLSPNKVKSIIKEFKDNGFNVTEDAITHNYNAWLCDLKSGYRDETNGYHLFSPCGHNPLQFRASTLDKSCEDWQTTYVA